MDKSKLILILSIFIVVTLSIIIPLSIFSQKVNAEVKQSCNLNLNQNTNLQPSKFFVGKSLITENHNKSYIKIEIPNEDFIIGQIANTGSMMPSLGNGSIFLGIKPNETDVKIGDIIIFYCSKEEPVIAHRIIDSDNGLFITKGDNNQITDKEMFNCTPSFKDISYKIVSIFY